MPASECHPGLGQHDGRDEALPGVVVCVDGEDRARVDPSRALVADLRGDRHGDGATVEDHEARLVGVEDLKRAVVVWVPA